MAQGINRYKADLREFQFLLFEQFPFASVLGKGPYESWDRDGVETVLSEYYKFVCREIGPLNSASDQGCKFVDGRVKAPPGFKEAWDATYAGGWKSLALPPEHGGQGAPRTLAILIEELGNGACVSFAMYPGLTLGAAEVIAEFGTHEQQERYLPKMFNGTWGGTMCLTEPHAGSDVGSAKSTARKLPNGKYAIKGAKIFISGGDHDLAESVVHLVLARVEGAPAGTKGLSLFIVPSRKVGDDGNAAGSNDVITAGIEHKLGINGSATCQLNFGENDDCEGELVGTAENHGMSQMFKLMNTARIAVGTQGTAIASSAYLNALEYAKDRKQGASITAWKDPTAPRVSIIEHADVRRMLLDMKSRVEGIRALIAKLTIHTDLATVAGPEDDEKKRYHQGQVDLLVPLVKSYGSDQGFRVCETAMQLYGGAGYLKDWPVEQYMRDAKIFSIYEGTNHIQAMDLVSRKLGQAGGANTQAFLGDIAAFIEKNKSHPVLGPSVAVLEKAHEALGGTTMRLLGWFQTGNIPMVPLNANRFLEMMSEAAVGWLLLDGARIAHEKLAGLDDSHADKSFYQGKIAAAVYYARNVLPGVAHKAEILAAEDDSALTIPDAGFATV